MHMLHIIRTRAKLIFRCFLRVIRSVFRSRRDSSAALRLCVRCSSPDYASQGSSGFPKCP